MSEVAESQKVAEMDVSFEAIEGIIKNLCMEVNLKLEWIVDHRFDEELSKLEDFDIFVKQVEIAKRFCQLRSVCKNKYDDLFAWYMNQSVAVFSRFAAIFVSDIRDNEEFRNAMQEFRPVLAQFKSALSAEDEKTDPIEFTTEKSIIDEKSAVSLADEKTDGNVSPPEKSNDDKNETPVEFGAAFFWDFVETMYIAASKIDCFPKDEGVEESFFMKCLRGTKEIQDTMEELVLDSKATNHGKDENTNNAETENVK